MKLLQLVTFEANANLIVSLLERRMTSLLNRSIISAHLLLILDHADVCLIEVNLNDLTSC